ncbi:putative RND efflux system, outer membrane lipoprotein, NodT family [Desulfonema magnum]|uniref:RND efflux system, outer membrane lipoprotein, NodT family n=1 Tax=Desulfonema magnum TaxID=45655 RepID=A0A975BVT8_9BACT|nr:putative RND efflux system, outer membrane lipoprotein, NodT family [Desulfonema magnum]
MTAAAFLLFSCQIHQPRNVSLSVVPERFSRTGTAQNKCWWESFQDTQLNRFAERVLSDNPNLKQAWARLEQARAMADQAGASRWPHLTVDARSGRSRTNIPVMPPASGTTASYNNQFSASAAVSYEVDLWGSIASLNKAAELDVKASQRDLETMAISLTAEIAETWFSIIEKRALLDLAHEQLKVNETYLKLIQFRFGQGQASALDVYQQRQQAAGTRAKIPPIESGLRVFLHQLSVLLGDPPQAEITEPHGNLPDLPELPMTGLPSALLKSRPDIQAVHFRVAAADHRVSAAIADRFPSLGLTASGGFRATELAELFENLIWDILGNLSGTLWDGGRKSAEVRRKRAMLEELSAKYVQTVLGAFQEVEDALVREEQQQIYLSKLNEQIRYAKMSLKESRHRYLNGLDDYLRVLTALESLQNLEQRLISAKKQLLSHRIQLYRAIGGIDVIEN